MLATSYKSISVASLTLLNPVGLSGEWLPVLTGRAGQRLNGTALDRLIAADAAIQPGTATAADPDALSEYAAAIYPAWFAFPELAAFLSPPRSTSITGAAVSARLRREGYDWHATVRSLPMPSLLIHGTADLLTLDMARDTVATLGPLATLLPVQNAGHNPFWEQPSIVFPAIDQFLARVEHGRRP